MPHPRELIVTVPASSSMGAHLLHLLLKPEMDVPFTSLFIFFLTPKKQQKALLGLLQGQRFFFFLESCQLDIFLSKVEV